MHRTALLIVLALCVGLAACANLRFPGVYRVDIAQGNFVTEDMISELRPGMTPEQVRYVLGAPVLTDPFTPDTWYYLLQYQPGQGEPTEQQIVVHFEGNQLSHYEGEVVANLWARTTGELDEEMREELEEGLEEGADPTPGPAPEPGGGPGAPGPGAGEPPPTGGGQQPVPGM